MIRMRISYDTRSTNALRNVATLDTVYNMVAPENATFQRRLAGPFVRVAAWWLDEAIIFVWLVLSSFGLGITLDRFEHALELLGLGSSYTIFITLFLLNVFFCFWFWNATFEALCNGRTPGKAAFGLRAISISGRKITWEQALIRNFLRLADFMLGPLVIPVMCSNNRMARLGDLAAGTLVVNDRLRKKAGANILLDNAKINEVASRIPDDFVVPETMFKALSLYVSRRLEISVARRYEIAAPLAGVLARRAKYPFRVDPDAFLCALWKKMTGDAA